MAWRELEMHADSLAMNSDCVGIRPGDGDGARIDRLVPVLEDVSSASPVAYLDEGGTATGSERYSSTGEGPRVKDAPEALPLAARIWVHL